MLSIRRLPAFLCLAVLLCVSGTSSFTQSPNSKPLALVGGTIWPSPTDAPIRDGVILIEGGRIAAVGSRASVKVPSGVETIDCSGLTIAAGFWNSHVHFFERKWLDPEKLPAQDLGRQLEEMLTGYGFTSVFDTWSMWDNTRRLRDRIESGEIPGPRIRSTGEAVFPRPLNAAPPTMHAAWEAMGFIPLNRFQMPDGSDLTAAVDATRKLLEAGTDGVKVYAVTIGRNGVALSDAVMQAVVKEGHAKGKPVFAHPTTSAGLLAAVQAGVDVLSHTTPQSGPWDDKALTAMKQANVALVPTLKLWQYELRHERVSLGEGWRETAVGQLRSWLGTGGVVLFGTDVGYMTDYDPSDEYALMAQAGMSAQQILASLTTAPADRFGASKPLGRIAPGLTADLAVLANDPSTNARAFANIRYTVRDGKVIYRSEGLKR